MASLLFHKLASEVRGITERRVFVELKRLVPARQDVFEFLRSVESAAELYAALDDPHDDFWAEYPEARPWVRVLRLLRAAQYKTVALVAFDKLADRPERVARLLQYLAFILVRATVVRVNTGDLQRAFQTTAQGIARGELKSPAAIARSLAPVTPSDEDFRAAFETLAIDPKGGRKHLVRYLLSMLESSAGGSPVDLDAAGATIEHILPENPASGWEAFRREDHARDCIRLGNLTPLETRLNRDLGASAFDKKRAAYAQSAYALTRSLVAEEWTPATLRARQAELAARAVSIWRLPAAEGDAAP